MPRMTRAALKAQAQADDYLDTEQPDLDLGKEQESQRSSPAVIHEDPADNRIGEELETDIHNADDLAVRQALRDITYENYPKADLNVEVLSQSPIKAQDRDQDKEQEQEQLKSTRKPKGKAKGRTKKKANTPTVVEPEDDKVGKLPEAQLARPAEGNTVQDSENTNHRVPEESRDNPQETVETGSIAIYEETSEPGPAIEEDDLRILGRPEHLSKPPKFDPAVHIPDEQETRSVEDSFVQSIKSRSPSKQGRSLVGERDSAHTSTDNLHAFTPLRRTSSSRFEESFEALDSLEDTIEQLTAGLPVLPADNMHSPESPAKSPRRAVRIEDGTSTPKSANKQTSRATSDRLQSAVKGHDKENTPPVQKTPLKSKTPLKAKAPVTKEATPLRVRTPAARQSSPAKGGNLSVRKTRTPAAAVTASELKSKRPAPTTAATTGTSASPIKASRQSTMVTIANKKSEPVTKKPASTLQRNASQRKASAAPAISKTEQRVRTDANAARTDLKKAHQTSKSVSNPSASQQEKPNVHKRRVTSGSILSTSKPAFVPAKSTKPPTTSTFSLPGEAIAEKLKAQKEAREEKMKQPKVTLAEQKAAKLKADREAREERVRQNQIKAKEEAEDKENRKPQRPVSMSALTISKARAEAAERGRLASKEWAEKMLKKKATADVKVVPVDVV